MEKVTPGIISLAPNQYSVSIGERKYIVTLQDGDKIRVDDTIYLFNLVRTGSGIYSLILDGSIVEVSSVGSIRDGKGNSEEVVVNGNRIELVVDDHRSLLKKGMLQGRSLASATQTIKAPMPGKVVRVEVSVGDSVTPGSGLIVLEAMKMENEIKATASGIVGEIRVAAGKAVEKGELLITIQPN